jgi:hypothetical protein
VPWKRDIDGEVAVLRLALDVSDPQQRARLESMFAAAFSLRRALQSDARARVSAYRAAVHERARDVAAVRDRLGLSRDALEDAASAHLDGAPHLRRFVTKALAMHLADNVWTAVDRHLFRDASGRTQGLLRIGRWYDFNRLPGRARSHTKARKWETFRLHGSLAGHRAAYTREGGRLVQPRRLKPVNRTTWWQHDGPLVVIFSGLADGQTLVLPVRLPSAPSNQAILDHYLSDPSKWHKIDLVRRRDPNADGGWRYEAHLMVLAAAYISPRVAARRATNAIAMLDRSAGIDINVSNITVASHARGEDLQITRIERTGMVKARDRSRARRERRRQRELDRSRRAMNRAQYQLSKRQQKRARRREARGLAPQQVIPAGPRISRSDGKPVVGYRRDRLSATYHRKRGTQVANAAAVVRAKRDHARQVAADIVRRHGYQFVVEDCNVADWSHRWGRALAAFSPGTLLSAIAREADAVGRVVHAGGVARASTKTALSQHCPCGARVSKKLAVRVHVCSACGLRGDRDAVAAVLASFIIFEQRDQPSSAFVDYHRASAALDGVRRALCNTSYYGWQDTLSESNALAARDGFLVAWTEWTPDFVAVARRTVGVASCSTLDETSQCWTKSERSRARANLFSKYVPSWPYLRDSS